MKHLVSAAEVVIVIAWLVWLFRTLLKYTRGNPDE